MCKRIGSRIIILLIIILIICLYFFQINDDLEVYFFDVGQGDSSMVILPGNIQVLIDGGPDEGVLDHLDKTMPFYDKTIELIILTHGDADHIAGLVEVIQDYKVQHVFMPDWRHDSKFFHSWEELLQENDIPVTFIRERFQLKIAGGVFDFLHPNASTSENRSINDESIVSKFSFKEFEILFSGDISTPVEERLVYEYGNILEADILKVPHHGSKSSSSKSFIQAVNGEIAVIQAGYENRFGHPHERVLYRYEEAGYELFRNDLLGTIHFKVTDESIFYDGGMKSFIKWLFGKNWERVYTFQS